MNKRAWTHTQCVEVYSLTFFVVHRAWVRDLGVHILLLIFFESQILHRSTVEPSMLMHFLGIFVSFAKNIIVFVTVRSVYLPDAIVLAELADFMAREPLIGLFHSFLVI
jgi:hypothetical protein